MPVREEVLRVAGLLHDLAQVVVDQGQHLLRPALDAAGQGAAQQKERQDGKGERREQVTERGMRPRNLFVQVGIDLRRQAAMVAAERVDQRHRKGAENRHRAHQRAKEEHQGARHHEDVAERPEPQRAERRHLRIGEDADHEEDDADMVVEEVLEVRRTAHQRQREQEGHRRTADADDPRAVPRRAAEGVPQAGRVAQRNRPDREVVGRQAAGRLEADDVDRQSNQEPDRPEEGQEPLGALLHERLQQLDVEKAALAQHDVEDQPEARKRDEAEQRLRAQETEQEHRRVRRQERPARQEGQQQVHRRREQEHLQHRGREVVAERPHGIGTEEQHGHHDAHATGQDA